MIGLWILACKPETQNTPQDLPDIPSVTIPNTDNDRLEATWSASDIENQFSAHSSTGIPSAAPFMETYFELLLAGDSTCPGSNTRLSPDNVEGCEASTGYSYYGLSVYLTIFDEIDETSPDNLEPIDGWIVIGDFEILTSENASFQAGGHITELFWKDQLGRQILEGELQGSWRWDDGVHNWQQYGISGLFTYEIFHEHRLPIEIQLNGAIQWNGQSIAFQDLLLLEGRPGFIGTVQLRDPSGLWHAITSNSLDEACATHSYADLPTETSVCLDWEHYISHFKSLIEEQ